MNPTPEDRRPPMTPQLALRVAVVGSCALAMFAIIFFRLWFLQVLSGDQYLAQATVNRVRDIAILPERGKILDSSGVVLADSRQALAVQISPPDLPASPHAQRVLYRNLARVLKLPTKRSRCVIAGTPPTITKMSPIACDVAKQLAILPYGNVTIKTDVKPAVEYYIEERQNEFPAVQVQEIYVRHYPLNTLASQTLGTIGPINAAETSDKAYSGIPPNSIIGQSGLEATYNRYLLGQQGKEQVTVNSLGEPTGEQTKKTSVPGDNLLTSLNERMQAVGQNALQQSINSNFPANGGAFVALNPDTGGVYAMGSLPTYNANDFASNLSDTTYHSLTSKTDNYPLLNRVIDSAGPTGSTFKPITATAALESGNWTTTSTYDDTGSFCTSPGVCRHNAGNASYGSLNLVNAIRVSSDTFFYHLGALINVSNPLAQPQGGPLQLWAKRYGIGQKTGIDLPGEDAGTLPTPAWRAEHNKLEYQCDRAIGPFRYTNGKLTSPVKLKGYVRSPKHIAGGCGIADGTNRPWSIGDNINLAVGQGDVQVTPLQLAVVYSALENGGTIVRPHIGVSIESQTGTVLQTIDPPPSGHIPINPLYRDTILEGLHEAAQTAGGTSDPVMGNFPETVFGKTGTAQYNYQQDYSWYACFVQRTPTKPPIVVIVTVEQGGFGAVAAAPVAREILSQYFFGKPGPYQAGSSQTL